MVDMAPEDVAKIKHSMPMAVRCTLVKFNNAVCVSGSFITNTLRGDRGFGSDIDVFCRMRALIPEVATWYIRKNAEYYASNKYRSLNTVNGITLCRENDTPIQFVCPHVWADPVDVISAFDFTITQAAVWFDKQGTWMGTCHDHYYEHIATRRLVLNDKRSEFTFQSIKRMLKFVRRGCTIEDSEVSVLMRRVYANKDANSAVDETEYSWDTIDGSVRATAADKPNPTQGVFALDDC